METDYSPILIYGSYGYTGNLIAELAVAEGLKPILAGRNEQLLKAQADRLKLKHIAFSLDQSEQLNQALATVDIVLHIAGPYAHTTKTMLAACMRQKTHYLDITGELEVFEWLASQQQALKEAGIVAIPGTGFDVVPTDCLAAYLKKRLPTASHLELAFMGAGEISRGTALTMVENISQGGMIRRNGTLTPVPAAYQTKEINFGERIASAVTIPWGDVSTAYHSTQIPNIMVYFAVDSTTKLFIKSSRYIGWLMGTAPIQSFLKGQVRKKVKGPSQQTREQTKSYVWGKAKDGQSQQTVEARLETPEAYKLTALTCLRSAQKLLKSPLPPGFYTPSLAFGADFILEFDGVKRIDIEQ
ncbi:MAG: saccharopine dehydrogenase family protein [Flammeovirgaceae bacterium]